MTTLSLLAPRADTLKRGPQGGSNVVLLSHAECFRAEGFQIEIFAANSDIRSVRELTLGVPAPLLRSLWYCGGFVSRSCGSVLIGYQEPTVALLAPERSIVRFGFYTPLPRYSNLPFVRTRFQASHYLFASPYLRDRWHAKHEFIPLDHTHVVPNAVDVRQFSPRREPVSDVYRKQGCKTTIDQSVRVGFAGQWTRAKGLDDLLLAWKRIEDMIPSAELLLVGGSDLWTGTDGLENRPLCRQVHHLSINKRICLLGKLPREEMPDFWRSVDVAVVPSKTQEGFGLVALEAMACGVPVVATRDGALPWLVGDGGIIVPRAEPASLADAILRLVSDPHLRAELGEKARRRGGRFSLERMQQELGEVISIVIEDSETQVEPARSTV